jgi:hypothetical protein
MYRRAVCNLGLLMEPLGKGWQGDEITARSVLVPACGGALLHPRNPSSVQLYGAVSPLLYGDIHEAIQIAEMLSSEPELRTTWALMQQESVTSQGTCVENLVNQWLEEIR